MVQHESSPSPAEKRTFFRLTCAGGGRVLSCWWHHGDGHLSSYEQLKKARRVNVEGREVGTFFRRFLQVWSQM